jgi:hypothetical protein
VGYLTGIALRAIAPLDGGQDAGHLAHATQNNHTGVGPQGPGPSRETGRAPGRGRDPPGVRLRATVWPQRPVRAILPCLSDVVRRTVTEMQDFPVG